MPPAPPCSTVPVLVNGIHMIQLWYKIRITRDRARVINTNYIIIIIIIIIANNNNYHNENNNSNDNFNL